MNAEQNKEFMDAQIEEIKKDAWIESEKAGHDVSKESKRNWIKRHAKAFREKWNKEHNISED